MYYITKFKKLIPEYSKHIIDDIYGENTFDTLIEDGKLTPFPNPSIAECIRMGGKACTIYRYKELYNCSLAEAIPAVNRMAYMMSD